MERVDVAQRLPPDLRSAISQGWEGITLLPDEDPLTLVVAGHPPSEEAGAGSLTIGAPKDAGSGGRVLVFGIDLPQPGGGPAKELRLGLDLAYAEARDVVMRLAERRRLRLLWACPDPRHGVLGETVQLGTPGAALLRRAVAHAAEWHVQNPRPPALGGTPDDPAAVLVAAEPPVDEVRLAAPAAALAGLDDAAHRLAVASRLVGEGGSDAADLTFLFSTDGRAGAPVRRVPVRLDDPEQRALAARLANQGQLVVLGVCRHGALRRCLRAIVTPAGRALIARAVAAAELRAA